MTEEIIIDRELSCNNCLEKTRCKQQQEVKVQRIDAILSYIANKDNEKYIAELKNEIPAITRCDVVLEKQLKKLEQENKELKEKIEDKPLQCIFYNDKQNKCVIFTKTVAYNRALREIREKIESLNKDICNNCGWYNTDNCQPNGYVCHDLIEIKNKINEVLQ